MVDEKQWYLSKGIWGSILAIVAVIAGYAGVEIDAETQAVFVDQIYAIVVAGAGLIGGVLSLIGRKNASKRIR